MTEEKLNLQQADPPGCTPVVSELVCVEAEVTITPTVTAGTPVVNCVDGPSLDSCVDRGFTPNATGSCTFTVSQVLCVNVPITFDATADTTKGTVACGTVSTGPNCPPPPPPGTGCVFTRGFFGNSPAGQELTAELITAFGPIILGQDSLGLTVTINNATDAADVFANTPPAPAPTNPPCPANLVAQYHALYAQLLTANLNVLNLETQGVAVCTEAIELINAANTFIASSPTPCGMTGAPAFTTLLTAFNEGRLSPSCPPSCDTTGI